MKVLPGTVGGEMSESQLGGLLYSYGVPEMPVAYLEDRLGALALSLSTQWPALTTSQTDSSSDLSAAATAQLESPDEMAVDGK